MSSPCKIESIFFSEFHTTEGPKIVLQVPDEVITKENFDVLQNYIIPKKHLHRRIIRVNSYGHSIIGYPISLEGEKFERNTYFFNCCLVLNSSVDVANYENIVRKLNVYLEHRTLQGFISNGSDKSNLLNLLEAVYNDLNINGKCHFVNNNSSSLHLKVDTTTDVKVCVGSYDVPIYGCLLSSDFQPILVDHIDLAGKQIVSLIDGERHVSKIAYEADMSIALVKGCVKRLVLHGAVSLIPIFQYCNVYVATPKIGNLFYERQIRDQCVRYVSLREKEANFEDVISFYSSFVHKSRLVDICIRLNPRSKGIDEKKLVQFGLVNGFIRQLKKYPIKDYRTSSTATSNDNSVTITYPSGRKKNVDDFLNGQFSFEEICGKTGISDAELTRQLEKDPGVYVCQK